MLTTGHQRLVFSEIRKTSARLAIIWACKCEDADVASTRCAKSSTSPTRHATTINRIMVSVIRCVATTIGQRRQFRSPLVPLSSRCTMISFI